jgi:hypothetical protein
MASPLSVTEYWSLAIASVPYRHLGHGVGGDCQRAELINVQLVADTAVEALNLEVSEGPPGSMWIVPTPGSRHQSRSAHATSSDPLSERSSQQLVPPTVGRPVELGVT